MYSKLLTSPRANELDTPTQKSKDPDETVMSVRFDKFPVAFAQLIRWNSSIGPRIGRVGGVNFTKGTVSCG